jgi:Predicted nucleotide-binding protein containing TIR-like domain
MSDKPKVFVACSSEAKDVADAVQQNLEECAQVTVWDDNAIQLSETIIDGLIRNCQESQFGVFVISPDDKVTIRDETLEIVRDNVILELGMFIGRLGKERSFIIRPSQATAMRLPSDLDGVNIGYYDAARKDNLKSAVNSVCRRITDGINRQSSQPSKQDEFLNSLIRFSLETVCRAMGVPSTPEQASLRVFIFRKEGDELVCRHYWDPNPSDEQVGITRFPINEEAAKEAIIVQCYLANQPKRMSQSHGADVSGNVIPGAEGRIKSDLKYILAVPIRNKNGSIWGVVDFDTSNDIGKEKLQSDLAGAVMTSLVRQLQVIVSHAR